ncbi:uncharacterized protein LOC118674733 [Myotis myotis]|uniref:uncharacterized protein LOC118674733 n=1 Tax=Myotis myotis TaxID=51298 RepID=UPI001749D106|nr:uncharacterized protein LOC118674733 [Myotis myotis]
MAWGLECRDPLGPESLFQSCIKDVDNHIPGPGWGAAGPAVQQRAAARGRQRPRLVRSGSSANGRRARASGEQQSQSAAGSQSARLCGGGRSAGARPELPPRPRHRSSGDSDAGTRASPQDASDRGARGGRRVCFLQVQSRRLEALAGRAGPNGNFLNNDQWLSTVSQYDRDKYWNRFRDTMSLKKVETASYNRLLTFRRKIFVDPKISNTPIPPLQNTTAEKRREK